VKREVTRAEEDKTAKKMRSTTATGLDEIPEEVWKSLRDANVEKQTELMQKMWREETLPVEWRDSVITFFLQAERRHPRPQQLQGHQADVTHNENLGDH